MTISRKQPALLGAFTAVIVTVLTDGCGGYWGMGYYGGYNADRGGLWKDQLQNPEPTIRSVITDLFKQYPGHAASVN